jgi:RHH-type proline utilization regulon transcriptional repressor/proline dehydrogenase/delta 1-pyrroline-5-carboxylate dehydrogenase
MVPPGEASWATGHAGQYEFQCLHGMGEPLYEQVVGAVTAGKLGRPCRIYAPVGTHETLLAYLVRRLLENGANTSFVNRIADPAVALEDLVQNPVQHLHADAAQTDRGLGPPPPHTSHCLPRCTVRPAPTPPGQTWPTNPRCASWAAYMSAHCEPLHVEPLLAQAALAASAAPETLPIVNPADHCDVLGTVHHASATEVNAALQARHRL